MTDNLDPGHNDPKVNVTFTHLDLEIPPVANHGGWVEAVRLMRLIRAKSGVIAGNILRGGPIEFFEGPWRIVDNDFRGTVPGTFSHGVFSGHGTHDLLVARQPGSRRRCQRQDLAVPGSDLARVRRCRRAQTDRGIGSLEGDTIPWSNEPEIILTEAYHVKYEGKVMALSGDGRLLRTGRPRRSAGADRRRRLAAGGPGGRRVAADRPGDRFLHVSGRPPDPGRHEGRVDLARDSSARSSRTIGSTSAGGRKSFGLVLRRQPLRDAGRQEPCAGGRMRVQADGLPDRRPR